MLVFKKEPVYYYFISLVFKGLFIYMNDTQEF